MAKATVESLMVEKGEMVMDSVGGCLDAGVGGSAIAACSCSWVAFQRFGSFEIEALDTSVLLRRGSFLRMKRD